jgi:flagellar basal-body rod protein FlgB
MADLFDKTTRSLAAAANMRQLKENIISANIANAETPGYTAKKVDFEESLSRALDLDGMNAQSGTTEPGQIPLGRGALEKVRADVYDNPDGEINNDGNTVDLEKEMSSLAENSIMYKAAIQLMNKKLAALKYAADNGGGR